MNTTSMTEKIVKTCKEAASNQAAPSVKEACIFLSEYAAWLLGCGATCIRIEKNVRRMVQAWNMTVDIIILPGHIHLVVWDSLHEHSYSNVERIRHTGISFNINTRLSKLSWAVADGKANFDEARATMESIVKMPPTNPKLVLLLASLANASFCRLFGGDFVSMGIVFLATLAGFRLKQAMLEDGADMRFTFFCCAFFSSVIGAAGYVFGLGGTPELALGTSVLYLIPGIPYINSVSDLLDGHYISSFSRLMNAAVLTACLSAGLCGGLLLMNIQWF